ncbi:hypothetical protein DVH24_003404 [Malus domestica]|uniref:Uncharacterized protein n=1 Tax=Malus domestica TaxID=3750 RepID=A0A498IHQ1_MALDO|nr:hypothetical protein DVH24_003404 [Malus domestica]
MAAIVSSLFLAQSAEEEEEEVSSKLSHSGTMGDRSVVNRKLFLGFLLWIKGEVSPYLLFLETGLSFFSCAK